MRRILSGVGEDPKAWNSRERLFGTPVDPQIFEARRCGLPHGSVRRCLHGFLDEEQIRGQHPDYDNGMLPLEWSYWGPARRWTDSASTPASCLEGRAMRFQEVERWGRGGNAAGISVAEALAEVAA